MGEPVTREIVSRLMVGAATPGQLLEHVRRRFEVSNSGVSDRITQLEELHALNRQRDGTVRLTDDIEPERIVQGARRWMKRALAAAAKNEEDDEDRLTEALELRDEPRRFEVSGVDGQRLAVTPPAEYLDDVRAKTEWARAAMQDPPELPDRTLQRLTARERPNSWPAVSWISEAEHSRSPADLVKSPARYLRSPARQLTISSDWQAFPLLVNRWVRRYQTQGGTEFLRWSIDSQLKLLVEAVLASEIVELERDPKHRGAFSEVTLRKMVDAAMPAIDADVERALHEAWGPPER